MHAPERPQSRSIRRSLCWRATAGGRPARRCGVGGWAATTEFAGAVIAPGSLVVESNVKKVQHPTGGVVGELRVRDGDRVKAGDVVVRLDETVTRANLAIVTKSLDELAARQARLEAERDGRRSGRASRRICSAGASDPRSCASVAGEQQAVRDPPRAREGSKGAAAGAHRPAAGADPGPQPSRLRPRSARSS